MKKTAAARTVRAPAATEPASEPATVELPADNGAAIVELPADLPEAPRGTDAYKSLGGIENSDSITVFRASETGSPAYLFTVDPENVPPDALMRRLRREYGPGEYRLQIREAGRIARNTRITIEAEPPQRPARVERDADDKPRGVDLTQFLLSQLTAQQNQTAQIITAALGRPLPPERQGPDVAKVLGAAAPLLVPLVSGIVELMKGTKPDPIELVRKFAEIRSLLTSDDDGAPRTGAGAMDVVMEGLRSLGPVVAQAMQAQQQRPPPRAPMPAAIKAQPVATTPPEAPPPVTRQQVPPDHPLILMLSLLVNAAVKASDPAGYVDVVLDAWPLGHEQLYAQLQAPNWLEQLARFEPRVTAHAPWFEQLREELLEAFDEGETAEAGGGSPEGGATVET